ncbi:hypothetical protein B0I35DRAFT_97934 [Stachybotrys elegans]|uniref:Uncharacterized protein n=1 Tax=Stachybotrys elegans TaxID=80388 RepID=A0A8K0SGB9_9HYPO|nr:hypothetical protein B0I35DRAFT_97934 [Stachybotrys elegans]
MVGPLSFYVLLFWFCVCVCVCFYRCRCRYRRSRSARTTSSRKTKPRHDFLFLRPLCCLSHDKRRTRARHRGVRLVCLGTTRRPAGYQAIAG